MIESCRPFLNYVVILDYDRESNSYIYITDDMKTGEIWTDKNQGLLFLLRNSEKFRNIYNSNNVEIWLYIGE